MATNVKPPLPKLPPPLLIPPTPSLNVDEEVSQGKMEELNWPHIKMLIVGDSRLSVLPDGELIKGFSTSPKDRYIIDLMVINSHTATVATFFDVIQDLNLGQFDIVFIMLALPELIFAMPDGSICNKKYVETNEILAHKLVFFQAELLEKIRSRFPTVIPVFEIPHMIYFDVFNGTVDTVHEAQHSIDRDKYKLFLSRLNLIKAEWQKTAMWAPLELDTAMRASDDVSEPNQNQPMNNDIMAKLDDSSIRPHLALGFNCNEWVDGMGLNIKLDIMKEKVLPSIVKAADQTVRARFLAMGHQGIGFWALLGPGDDNEKFPMNTFLRKRFNKEGKRVEYDDIIRPTSIFVSDIKFELDSDNYVPFENHANIPNNRRYNHTTEKQATFPYANTGVGKVMGSLKTQRRRMERERQNQRLIAAELANQSNTPYNTASEPISHSLPTPNITLQPVAGSGGNFKARQHQIQRNQKKDREMDSALPTAFCTRPVTYPQPRPTFHRNPRPAFIRQNRPMLPFPQIHMNGAGNFPSPYMGGAAGSYKTNQRHLQRMRQQEREMNRQIAPACPDFYPPPYSGGIGNAPPYTGGTGNAPPYSGGTGSAPTGFGPRNPKTAKRKLERQRKWNREMSQTAFNSYGELRQGGPSSTFPPHPYSNGAVGTGSTKTRKRLMQRKKQREEQKVIAGPGNNNPVPSPQVP